MGKDRVPGVLHTEIPVFIEGTVETGYLRVCKDENLCKVLIQFLLERL